MRQANKPTRARRKRCVWCQTLFKPDPRSKGRQKYCSKPECQRKRQRQNERQWRLSNPECLAYQRQQSRQWHRTRPDYSRQRRAQNPEVVEQNRGQSRLRMQRIREQRLFDKSKVILTQLTGGKSDACYLTPRCRWLMVRLTKASPFSKWFRSRDNRPYAKRLSKRSAINRFYEVPDVFD
jgi:hypothetical protein